MWVVMVVTWLSLSGCLRNRTMPPGEVLPDPISHRAYPQQVALEGLESYVVSGESTVQASQDQPLSVEVPLRAVSNKELSVQYRFLFFDKDRRLLKPQMQWRYTTLTRAQQFVRGSALDTRAVDWRLEVRPAR